MKKPRPGQLRFTYSWEDFDEDCRVLARQIINRKDIRRIYGIPKGGIVIAIRLSYMTGLVFVKSLEFILPHDTLIVDDISDSGKTLLSFRDYPTATLHVRNTTKHIPTFFVRLLRDKSYIDYPWEV